MKIIFLIKPVECLSNISKNDLFPGLMRYSVSTDFFFFFFEQNISKIFAEIFKAIALLLSATLLKAKVI